MDLIVTDANGIDQGVLRGYTLDEAYGADENDFTLTVPVSSHILSAGCRWYLEDVQDGQCIGTEYGGIVDSIATDTGAQTVTYSGRTWHGVLESRVIAPDSGQDYLYVSGDANDVLRMLIERIGLSGLFTVSEDVSEVQIAGYQFPRYVMGYSGICDMLYKNGGKLTMAHVGQHVVLSAVPYCDYSNDEEWDSSQIDLSMKQSLRPVNHLICLGQGDLKDRAVIHLFTDEGGGVQPYAVTDHPLQDSDYILDTSQKVLFGLDEVVDVYDYSSAEVRTNYLPLTVQPADWASAYSDYYELSEGGDYDAVEAVESTVPVPLTKRPSDWSTNYTDYYYKSGSSYENLEPVEKYELTTAKPANWDAYCDEFFVPKSDGVTSGYDNVEWNKTYSYQVQTSKPTDWEDNYGGYYRKSGSEYVSVNGVEHETQYKRLTKCPSDWSKNYASYFYYFWDGAKGEYRSVSADTFNYYKLHTAMPTDWISSWKWGKVVSTAKNKKTSKCEIRSSYYVKNSKGKYVEATYTFTQSYKNAKNSKLPSAAVIKKLWKKKKFYSKYSSDRAPKWNSYAGKYAMYSGYTPDETAPPWKANTYYIQIENRVAPAWAANKYYERKEYPPKWKSNTYYADDDTPHAPKWQSGRYFYAVEDRYAELVEGGIEQLEELSAADEISIDLGELGGNYDIGDVVGATDNETGISVWQPVTKKILKIEDGTMSLSYEIGGNVT